ncbi:hypothetical protein LJ739_14345 [Aestuariibacter halophilus]|uniref:Esterase n=1 Tax=Fluctibacter halophilus TaxID=226011 RepID=A0ABS8GA25_9ALTE|nr:alpha/beta hydrolase-fold protein [Aestuariibacter halophilus]MCC2617429.1 hypothetical protein [Aestuariibacter halophilus]
MRSVFVLLLVFCAVGCAVQQPLSVMQGLTVTGQHALQRQAQGKTQRYQLLVSVPAQTTEAPLPLVLLLDGGRNFPLLASYASFLQLEDSMPPVIVAALSYGADSFEKGNGRSHDYTAPAVERDFWGGAAGFDAFITEQVLPVLSAHYPVDPQRQILLGQSLGGQFALYTAMHGTSPWSGVIAINPALHRNLSFFLQPSTRSSNVPAIALFSADQDAERFQAPLRQWIERWRRDPALPLHVTRLQGHTHLSANPEGFRQGVLALLKQAEPPLLTDNAEAQQSP